VALNDKIEKLRKPRCKACGEILEGYAASKNPSFGISCDDCLTIDKVKQNWKPIGTGKISKIFHLPN